MEKKEKQLPADDERAFHRHFVLAMRLRLLQRALASWPRRAAPLLEVNCGRGDFLPFLWQSGFDVEATEGEMEARIAAQNRKIPGLAVTAAAEEDLPFGNDAFDWVILNLRSRHREKLGEACKEALRVARRGVMLTFWNSFSMAGITRRLRQREIPFHSWWQVARQARKLHQGRMKLMCALCGPECTWKKQSPLSFVNAWITGIPIGAWCIVRLDLSPRLATPLAASLREVVDRQEPALEYKPLSSSSKKSASHENEHFFRSQGQNRGT